MYIVLCIIYNIIIFVVFHIFGHKIFIFIQNEKYWDPRRIPIFFSPLQWKSVHLKDFTCKLQFFCDFLCLFAFFFCVFLLHRVYLRVFVGFSPPPA